MPSRSEVTFSARFVMVSIEVFNSLTAAPAKNLYHPIEFSDGLLIVRSF